ncbi:hypothetical protein ABZ446_28300 [Streptomyces sp. NPDC005813]|uniref:hypothetical protein n=1 Tax=Streptomyces sp. NPDC005813 TaxID=3155592 RepID=UPI0033C9BEDC
MITALAIAVPCLVLMCVVARVARVDVLFYRMDKGRFGVGPVGDSWREAIGISGGAFGRAVAIYRIPADVRRWLEGVPK